MFFLCAGALFSSYSLLNGDRDSPTRVALNFGDAIETMAPPTVSVMPPAGKEERIEPAPTLRDGAGGEEPYFAEAEDSLEFDNGAWAVDAASNDILEQPGEVVITIDGAPARRPGDRATGPQAASLMHSSISIPDPDPAMLQQTPLGRIPRIASDGRKASSVYARPFAAGGDKRVALIVGGLGLNRALTERAIDDLPPQVTLAFAPYAKDLKYWTARAREAGHEIMIELPMEAHGADANALGPAALLTSRSSAENLQRLDWLLARFGGYVAATNYQGGKFAADDKALIPVLARLNALGVGYVDDTGAARRALSGDADAAAVSRMIAPQGDGASIEDAKRDLDALKKIAARNGAALGKTYAFDATIDAVSAWANDLDGGDVALAPASALFNAQQPSSL